MRAEREARAAREAREISYPPAPETATTLAEPPAPTPVLGVPSMGASAPAGMPPVAPPTARTGIIKGVTLPGMKIGQLCFFDLSSPALHPYGSQGLGSHYQGQRGPTPSRTHERFTRTRIER